MVHRGDCPLHIGGEGKVRNAAPTMLTFVSSLAAVRYIQKSLGTGTTYVKESPKNVMSNA